MSTIEYFDIIIVGGGPMGLASAYECGVKERKKVLILERFADFANVYGSSPGYSRQFRVSYSEKNLSDLALQTFDMWQELMKEMKNDTLLQVTGCLWFGDPNVETGEGNIDQAIQNLKELGQKEHDDYKVFDGKEAIMNARDFSFVSNAVAKIDKPKALYTVKGGTVNVPAVVQCYYDKLKPEKTPNATIMKDAQVIKIDYTNEEYIEVKVNVKEQEKTYHGEKIILTPGTYINEVLNTIHPPFNYEINLTNYIWSSTYFTKHVRCVSESNPAKWPIWYFFGPKPKDGTIVPRDYNDYYGFPSEPGRPGDLKVGAAFTSEKKFNFSTLPPPIKQRPVDENALMFASTFVHRSMPDLDPTRNTDQDMTCVAGFAKLVNSDAEKDEGAGFVLDFLRPDVNRIVLFTGGWAMKFVPMIGKILTDLAIRGNTNYQELIHPMNINRGILKKKRFFPLEKLRPSKCSIS